MDFYQLLKKTHTKNLTSLFGKLILAIIRNQRVFSDILDIQLAFSPTNRIFCHQRFTDEGSDARTATEVITPWRTIYPSNTS